MATVICLKCKYPQERSFYRGYSMADDRSSCCKAKLKRFKRGADRYWRGNECGKHWPPIAGIDKGIRMERPDAVWRWHDYQCPDCGEQFKNCEWQSKEGLWPGEPT